MTADFNNDSPIPPEINKYLAILSKDPGSMVFAPLAEAYRKAGMLDEAIATALEGLKLHPNYVSGMVALGRAYSEKGRLAEAREILGKVLVIAPDNIIAANVLQEIKPKPEEKAYGSTYVPKPEPAASLPSTASKQDLSPEDEGVWFGAETEPAVRKPEALATPTSEPAPLSEGDEGWLGLDEEPAFIEPVQLEEIEEIPAAEEIMAEDGGAATTFGDEISEELWTGEVAHEAPEAEEDVRPKKEITTSTIADLYIKQGYLDKAIDIYQTIYDSDPYNEDVKKKLDELKKGIETKSEGQKPTAERVESSGVRPEISNKKEMRDAVEAKKLGEQEGPTDENIKMLESWLKTIQSERH